MSARQPRYDSVARQWLALAVRGRAHLVEPRESGPLEAYLTEAVLDQELRDWYAPCPRRRDHAASRLKGGVVAAMVAVTILVMMAVTRLHSVTRLLQLDGALTWCLALRHRFWMPGNLIGDFLTGL